VQPDADATSQPARFAFGASALETRKVSERMVNGGAVSLIEEKIYFGNYEIKRNKSVNTKGEETTTLERQTLRIMDGSTCVVMVNYMVKGDGAGTRMIRFQMSDNLGSITSEYDKDAQLITYEEYFPYGGTAIIAGTNQAEVKLKDYRYSGKERDDSTGLYYYGARYYAPWLGKWLNPDPAGTVDGTNLYAFVGGNPITHVDIDGRRKRRRLEESEESEEIDNKKLLKTSLGKGKLTTEGKDIAVKDDITQKPIACWNWALTGGKGSIKDVHSPGVIFDYNSGIIQSTSKGNDVVFSQVVDPPEEFPNREKVMEEVSGLKTVSKTKKKSTTKNQKKLMEKTVRLSAIANGLTPNDQGDKSDFTLHMQTVKGKFWTWEHWGIGVLRDDNTRSIIQTLPGKVGDKNSRTSIRQNTSKMWDPDHEEVVVGIDDLLPEHYEVLLKKREK
jgi:RHS repeat-associated protein